MAGEWIKVERATPDKPEVLRISRELAIDRDAVFGKLMLVWMWFDANSVDGVVDGAVDADVDVLVRHQGFASVMRSVRWLFDSPSGVGLSLPNFSRHNGETAKKRALSNRRQAKWRNASVDGHVDGRPSTTASTREEKRREDIKTPLPPSGAFLRFWGSWPRSERKRAQGKCWELWRRRDFDQVSEHIISHVEALKPTDSWQGGFIPAPLVYLNQRQWEGAELAQPQKVKVDL